MKKLIFCFFILLHFSNINAQTLEIKVSSNKTDVLTCETFTYSLKYTCASTTTNCTNVTLTAAVPSGIIFPSQSVGYNPDIQSSSFSTDRRSITFTFKDPLIAGSTGIINLTGQGECGLPEGTMGT